VGLPGGGPDILWRPRADARTTTNIGRYLTWLGEARDLAFDGYDDLWRWSTTELDASWSALAEHLGVRWHHRPAAALAERRMPGAAWFPGGTLSYSEHALAAAATRPNEVAVVGRSQTRPGIDWTWAELVDQVRRLRAGLRRLGVGPGDRVAAYLPNLPETVAAFLATASLGALWTSCAPEFGTRSVIDRLAQVEPVVLLAVDGYRYGAKVVDRRAEVAAIRAGLPGLRATVVLGYLDPGAAPPPGAVGWDALAAATDEALAHAGVPFDHPLYLLFSSGTTGLPKPIVHGTGGITLEHLKVLSLHHDLGPGDRFTWFTTTGWMMWDYLVSGLLVGATIVLFDGDPSSPDLATLWRLAADSRCTLLGVSAPFLMACRKAGVRPRRAGDLSALSQVGSTGAPLPAEGFRWVHDELGGHVLLSSISGGTDVCTAFVGMTPLTPVWEGEISRPLLGCAAAAVRPDGSPAPVGQQGELVITEPMPSMPLGFWGDVDGSRLRAAYFEEHPTMWSHGDWVTFTERGSCVVSGRSDATLNRGGVRLGTADFYAVVEGLPEVADSLVVHLEAGDQLLLFVVPSPGVALDEELRRRIRTALRTDLSPRHVPDRIDAVPSIPRTLSGKKLEVPVKRILQGTPPVEAAARGALADPTSLDAFVPASGGRAGEGVSPAEPAPPA
jgi:acetoacetyl-CoA synthetase